MTSGSGRQRRRSACNCATLAPPAKLRSRARPVDGKVLESRLEGHAVLDGFELSLAMDNLLNRKADSFASATPCALRRCVSTLRSARRRFRYPS